MIFLAHYSTFVAASGAHSSCRNQPLGPKMFPTWSQDGPKMESEIRFWRARLSRRISSSSYCILASQGSPQRQGQAAGDAQTCVEVKSGISMKREGFASEWCIFKISVLQQSVEEGITIGNSESSADQQ